MFQRAQLYYTSLFAQDSAGAKPMDASLKEAEALGQQAWAQPEIFGTVCNADGVKTIEQKVTAAIFNIWFFNRLYMRLFIHTYI